jgi:hypothetical protein
MLCTELHGRGMCGGLGPDVHIGFSINEGEEGGGRGEEVYRIGSQVAGSGPYGK